MPLEDQLASLTEAISALTSALENQTKTILRGTSEGAAAPQKTPKEATAPTAVPETPAVVKVEDAVATKEVPTSPEAFYKETLAPAFTELVTKNRTAAVRILADFGIAKLVAAPVASYNDIYHAVQEAITNG